MFDCYSSPFMQLAESAKAQFAARDYSDHLALVRAYEGWKDAEAQRAGNEYCWRNFLSSQTLRAIDSLRKQFFYLLKDIGLVDHNADNCNTWSHDENLVRAVICAGLFPGICSVVVIYSTSFHFAKLLLCVYYILPVNFFFFTMLIIFHCIVVVVIIII